MEERKIRVAVTRVKVELSIVPVNDSGKSITFKETQSSKVAYNASGDGGKFAGNIISFKAEHFVNDVWVNRNPSGSIIFLILLHPKKAPASELTPVKY